MKKFNRIKILNTPIDSMTMKETVDYLDEVIRKKKQVHHTVVNAGKIVLMHENRELYESVVNADIINADGAAVVWTSKLLKKPLPERVAGIDLMENLVKLAHEKKYKVFLFGAEEKIVSKVAEIYSKKYSPKIIAGYINGYFKKEDEIKIADKIAKSKANILLVAISSPVKEIFLFNHKEKLKNINVIMGVGGSFDVVAGKVTRAPKWMQNIGMEWFYRVLQEPRRMFKRYLVGNSKYIKMVIKEYFGFTNKIPEK